MAGGAAGPLLMAIVASSLSLSALAEDEPRDWAGALDLRRAITIKADHVAVTARELAAAGVEASDFTPPKRTQGASPPYPEVAARDSAQGSVLMDCLISDTGAVRACRLTHSVHPAIDRAAMRAIERWRYEPARVSDQPKSVVVQFMMVFRLQ